MKTISKYLLLSFYISLALILITIIICSFSEPRNNLIAWQVIIISIIMSIGMLFCIFLLCRICLHFSEKKLRGVLFGLLVLVFIGLYIVSCMARNKEGSFFDYGIMYSNAISYNQGTLLNEDYFCIYSNNIIPMLLLSRVMLLSEVLHLKDPYYLVAFGGTAISIIAIISGICMLGKDKFKFGLSFSIVGLFISFLPLWTINATLYTDHMSFGVAVMSLALIKGAIQNPFGRKQILLSFLSAIVMAFGVFIKVTTVIPLIASVVVLLLVDSVRKKAGKLLIVWGAVFLLTVTNILVWSNSIDIVKKAKDSADPVLTWVGLGLYGDGSFGANTEYIYTVHSFATKEEKEQYVEKYLVDNKKQFFDLEHIISKIRYNYASGFFGAIDYVYYPEIGFENHFLWEITAPYGKYYWRSSQYSFSFIFSIYLIYLLGCIVSIRNLIKWDKVDNILLVVDISFMGYFIFLMLWEANNRQLYNFVPLLLVGMILHSKQILQCLCKKGER